MASAPPRRSRRPLLLALGSVVVLTLVLAACGGGSTSTAAKATTTTTTAGAGAGATTTRSAAFAKYDACMTSHGIPASALTRRRFTPGVTSGSPTGGGSSFPTPSLPAGVTQAQYTAAVQACRSLRPAGGFGGFGANFNSAAFAAYRNCLQVNGVTLPAAGSTPSTSVGSTATTTAGAPRGLGTLNPSNPTVAKALKACANLRPARSTTSTTVASS